MKVLIDLPQETLGPFLEVFSEFVAHYPGVDFNVILSGGYPGDTMTPEEAAKVVADIGGLAVLRETVQWKQKGSRFRTDTESPHSNSVSTGVSSRHSTLCDDSIFMRLEVESRTDFGQLLL